MADKDVIIVNVHKVHKTISLVFMSYIKLYREQCMLKKISEINSIIISSIHAWLIFYISNYLLVVKLTLGHWIY